MSFPHRMVVVVTAAQMKTLNTSIKANLDITGGDWFTQTLNPSGLSSNPVTHYWCCFGGTDADAKLILVKLCQVANIPDPAATWDAWGKAQKLSWINSNVPTILSKCGIYLFRFDNDGVWDDPAKALATMGLKVINRG